MTGEPEGMLLDQDEATPAATETPTPETPESETPSPETPETPKPADAKVTPEVQKRIDQLTKEKHEAKRQADALKAELDAVKRKAEAGARPQPPDLTKLTNADGQLDPVKYQQAQAKYDDDLYVWRKAQEAPPAEAAAEPESEQRDVPTPFVDGVKALGAQHPDVYEVINRPVFTPEMREAVWESEQGPQLAYYLGTHQADALRLGELPARQMLRELGKIEAKLSAPASPPARVVSEAPAPIAPVGGTASVTTKDPDKMSTEEFMAWDRARVAERMKTNPLGL